VKFHIGETKTQQDQAAIKNLEKTLKDEFPNDNIQAAVRDYFTNQKKLAQRKEGEARLFSLSTSWKTNTVCLFPFLFRFLHS